MRIEKEDKLPSELQELVGDDQITLRYKNTTRTYFIQSSNGYNRYLKVQPINSDQSLDREAKRIMWLHNMLAVPKIIDCGVIGDYEYLLTEEVPGVEASSKNFSYKTDEMIKIIARGLQEIHEIAIDKCPFDNSIKKLMKIIYNNHDKGIIDTSDLSRKFGESNLNKLLFEVEVFVKDLEEDLIFTHGDYSLPNIIIDNGSISGYIDLGNCGIADRYYDLAVVEKSIKKNFGLKYVKLFFEQYGIKEVDYKKIRFYQIVEHLVSV